MALIDIIVMILAIALGVYTLFRLFVRKKDSSCGCSGCSGCAASQAGVCPSCETENADAELNGASDSDTDSDADA